MTRILRTTPFLFLLGLQAQAQVFEHVDQRTESVGYGKTVAIGGGRWVTAASANTEAGIPVPGFYFAAFGTDGQPTWERSVEHLGGHGMDGDLISLPDSGLLTVGRGDYCDVMSGISILGRYDQEGGVIWETVIHHSEWPYVTMLARAPGTDIAAASSDSVYRFNWNGERIDAFHAPGQGVVGLHWYQDSLLLVLSEEELFVVDTAGTPVDTFPLPGIGVALRVFSDQAFVLMDEGLIRMQLTDGTTLMVGSGNEEPVAFVEGPADRLFVRSAGTLYEVFPDGAIQSLGPIGTVPSGSITGAVVLGDHLYTSGNTNIGGRSSAVRRGQAIAGEQAMHDEDIEILVTTDSSWFVAGPTPPGNLYWQYASLTAHVVNHGPAPLHRFVLSYRTPHAIAWCGTWAMTMLVDGIELLPGDTVHIPWHELPYDYSHLTPPGSSLTASLCIAALAPNLLADRNPTDNYACTDVLFVNTVGVADHASMPVIAVHPNPFSDRFTITGLPPDARQATLLDAAGRDVRNVPLAAHLGYATIDPGHLPPGMYRLVVDTPHGRWGTAVVRMP